MITQARSTSRAQRLLGSRFQDHDVECVTEKGKREGEGGSGGGGGESLCRIVVAVVVVILLARKKVRAKACTVHAIPYKGSRFQIKT